MKHVRPYWYDNKHVIAQRGPTVCPYCESQSTGDAECDSAGWIECPIQNTPPRFICLGCCEDIYSTCASENFESHPFLGLVEDAAKKENITVAEYRVECLRQQLKAAEERRNREGTSKYDERAKNLTQLLKSLIETDN
jgi:hypothetical protein